MTIGAARLVGGAILLIAAALRGLFTASWLFKRHSLVSRVVDQGACADTVHVSLELLTPPGSRELFGAAAACRARVFAMSHAAPNYICRSTTTHSICEHPLDAADHSTYVCAVVSRDHVLLETIAT